jgi:hypothetical protein
MSILKALGVRSMALSFLEVLLFFLVLTQVYFLLLAVPYALAIRAGGQLNFWMVSLPLIPSSLGQWGEVLPVWMWVVELAGYVLLITIYWAPGDAGLDRAELGGLVIFLTAAVVGGLAYADYRYRAVEEAASVFWRILSGQMIGGS